MGLVNFIAFLLLKILYNLVSMKYFLNAITGDINKILKSVQSDLTFIYDVLSELRIGFVSFLVILALENVVNFTKKMFLSKLKQRNYV